MFEYPTHVMLKEGETILATDEMVGGDKHDAWHTVHEHLVGRRVWSNWRYASNMKFRRRVVAGMQSLPRWRKDRFGWPIETFKGRPVKSAIRIICQNIRKITG